MKTEKKEKKPKSKMSHTEECESVSTSLRNFKVSDMQVQPKSSKNKCKKPIAKGKG